MMSILIKKTFAAHRADNSLVAYYEPDNISAHRADAAF